MSANDEVCRAFSLEAGACANGHGHTGPHITRWGATWVGPVAPGHARAQIFSAIDIERKRQTALHGDKAIDGINAPSRLAILMEEVGEVARSLLDGNGEVDREELVQVAAVCVGWLEALS